MNSLQDTHPTALTAAQINEILSQLEQLVRLVAPLTALLSGALGMTGGAGQRLEELIQQLTSVSTGLHQNVEDLTLVFGPNGTLTQMEKRLVEIEVAMRRAAVSQANTAEQMMQIGQWISGTA